jgi:hypothetical protein
MSIFDGSVISFAGFFGFVVTWFRLNNPNDEIKQSLEDNPKGWGIKITKGLNGRQYTEMPLHLRFAISFATGLSGAVVFGYLLKWFPF